MKTVKSRFKMGKDGWIKDLNSGIEYGPSAEESMNFNNAVEYCKSKGGRLPSRQELEAIQDLTKCDPCINKIFKETKSGYYWSDTLCAFSKNCRWCVSFSFGSVSCYSGSRNGYVRPVRSSQ